MKSILSMYRHFRRTGTGGSAPLKRALYVYYRGF